MLQNRDVCGTILPRKRGAWCCPVCGRRLITIDVKTQARNFPVFCIKCKRDIYVNIDSGLCYLSQSPEARGQSARRPSPEPRGQSY